MQQAESLLGTFQALRELMTSEMEKRLRRVVSWGVSLSGLGFAAVIPELTAVVLGLLFSALGVSGAAATIVSKVFRRRVESIAENEAEALSKNDLA